MARISETTEHLQYSQFPAVLATLCSVLFLLFWFLALAVDTGLKPLHYTLFNFLLIAILALQKYHRLECSAVSSEYRLLSVGLLSGVQRWQGDLDEISGLYVEPGFGGVRGSGGRLLLQRTEKQALILSSADIVPGAHGELELAANRIEKWLTQTRG
ncbi:MAG TPA: hypothetical protein VLA39_07470 [Marinobacterium sp.]|nr:hypothetical protein [Marinobacterium sp.]